MNKQAVNPYLPSYEYVPDGEPRVFGDRVYIYGSHDAFNGNNFCVNDYVCWSAPLDDLANWRYEGVIYKSTQDPKNKNGKMDLYAPDCVQGPDGKYYLYYEFAQLTVTSVAVSDTPAGRFEFYGYVQEADGTPYGQKKGQVNCFDPGVFVDDESVYLYTGFSPTGIMKKMMSMRGLKLDGGYCLKLDKDMITILEGPVYLIPGPEKSLGTEFEGHGFFEASSMRKINGKYYFTYSSELSHELCYAVSDYPDKDFRYGGTLISIGDIGYKGNTQAKNYLGNTHGGMVQIGDQWYIFYHRQTNKQKCARQGCAEKMEILADGSIPQVEMTSCGLNSGVLKGRGIYEARIACNLWSKEGVIKYDKPFVKDKKKVHPYFTQSGTDREENGDQYIANLKDGSVAGFKYFELEANTRIVVWIRGTAQGELAVSLEPDGDPVSRIPISPTMDWKQFDSKESVDQVGEHGLYFKFVGTGSLDFRKFELK